MGKAGVGMPVELQLHHFGAVLFDAFGHVAYQVGSSLQTTEWRDVDVRLILPDDEYERLFGDPARDWASARWRAHVLAFSALGRSMTGLPIDFQIQQQTHANKYEGERSALHWCIPRCTHG